MNASSESGLCAMEISIKAGAATPDVCVLTVGNYPFEEGGAIFIRCGEANFGLSGTVSQTHPTGGYSGGGGDLQRVSGQKRHYGHRQCRRYRGMREGGEPKGADQKNNKAAGSGAEESWRKT